MRNCFCFFLWWQIVVGSSIYILSLEIGERWKGGSKEMLVLLIYVLGCSEVSLVFIPTHFFFFINHIAFKCYTVVIITHLLVLSDPSDPYMPIDRDNDSVAKTELLSKQPNISSRISSI